MGFQGFPGILKVFEDSRGFKEILGFPRDCRELQDILGYLRDSWGFYRILQDSREFQRIPGDSREFQGIPRDSGDAGGSGDSRGFWGFLILLSGFLRFLQFFSKRLEVSKILGVMETRYWTLRVFTDSQELLGIPGNPGDFSVSWGF